MTETRGDLGVAAATIEYPSSALRYGLLTVKPIPFDEIVKRHGMKFRERGIRYQPEEQFENYEDYVGFRYEQMFARMPLPKSFPLEKLLEHFVKTATKSYEEDKELQNELKRKDTSLEGFVNFITNRFESRIPQYYATEASRFYKSNLPLSFFTNLCVFIDTYQKYLALISRIVRRYELLSNLPGTRDPLRSTKAHLDTMKRVLAPLIDKMDQCALDSSSLKLYVCLWSSESFEEIDDPRFLDTGKLDQVYFTEYALSYNTQIRIMRKMLFDLSKIYDPDVFNREVSASGSTTTMLSKLVFSDLG